MIRVNCYSNMTDQKEIPVIIYDGECRFCRQAVKFLDTSKSSAHVNFVPSTDASSNDLLETFYLPKDITEKSVILIENRQVFTKSSAVIRALKRKGGVWRISGVLLIIPAFIRNLIYDWIARNR